MQMFQGLLLAGQRAMLTHCYRATTIIFPQSAHSTSDMSNGFQTMKPLGRRSPDERVKQHSCLQRHGLWKDYR
jgi:hypothetical protein